VKRRANPMHFVSTWSRHSSRVETPLFWTEVDKQVEAHPERWGDVVLGRKQMPASYHLAAVLDDALQGVTHVVRGKDLFESTAVHRLLQELLGLPAPTYRHHHLLVDESGKKLSKRDASTTLRDLRESGVSVAQMKRGDRALADPVKVGFIRL
jgi:glutamyl-Q tRNA(Asp) synthetase